MFVVLQVSILVTTTQHRPHESLTTGQCSPQDDQEDDRSRRSSTSSSLAVAAGGSTPYRFGVGLGVGLLRGGGLTPGHRPGGTSSFQALLRHIPHPFRSLADRSQPRTGCRVQSTGDFVSPRGSWCAPYWTVRHLEGFASPHHLSLSLSLSVVMADRMRSAISAAVIAVAGAVDVSLRPGCSVSRRSGGRTCPSWRRGCRGGRRPPSLGS